MRLQIERGDERVRELDVVALALLVEQGARQEDLRTGRHTQDLAGHERRMASAGDELAAVFDVAGNPTLGRNGASSGGAM